VSHFDWKQPPLQLFVLSCIIKDDASIECVTLGKAQQETFSIPLGVLDKLVPLIIHFETRGLAQFGIELVSVLRTWHGGQTNHDISARISPHCSFAWHWDIIIFCIKKTLNVNRQNDAVPLVEHIGQQCWNLINLPNSNLKISL